MTSGKITDGTITSADVADDTLTAADLSADSVGSSKIASGEVGTSEIADGCITAVDLSASLLNGSFWNLGGNTGTTPGTQFLGTTDNQALELKVNGQRGIRLEYADDVALAAIQGLNQKVEIQNQETMTRIQKLTADWRQRLQQKDTEMDALKQELADLKRRVDAMFSRPTGSVL